MIKDIFGMAPLTEILLLHMLNPELIGGGHGVKHALHTVMIAEQLHEDLGHTGNDVAVRCAAAFHDIGRLSSGGDMSHGFRGVPVSMAAMDDISDHLLPSQTVDWLEAKGMVACIIAMHCYPIMGNFTEMKIVMDADKLGRYRMGVKNWPDPDRLALHVSRDRMKWAKALILQ